MRRCLNCRRTYDDKLTRCPFCGYRPRTKNNNSSNKSDSGIGKTAELNFEHTVELPKSKNIKSVKSHAGAFYLQSGEKLNSRYSVMNVMGFGSFGVAYECFDSNTQTNVVVKEYFPSFIADRSRLDRDIKAISDQMEASFEIGAERFIDENKKLRDNDVRCVPGFIDYFKENNTYYVVTELVHGEALSSIIRRKGRLPYQATTSIITGVLQGLRQFNRLGIIHGDICPDNIIVTNSNEVYLLDYNLSDFNKAVYTQRDPGKLRAGYSALELYYDNMQQGPWTDVYAAGAVMYKMMTGITVPSAIKRNTSDSLTAPSKLGVSITQSAEKAMLKALRVDYEKRIRNPEDFLNGLTGDGFDDVAIAKQVPASPGKTTPIYTEQPKKSSSGSGRILAATLIFLVTAIIGVVIWLFIADVFHLPGMNEETEDEDSYIEMMDTEKSGKTKKFSFKKDDDESDDESEEEGDLEEEDTEDEDDSENFGSDSSKQTASGGETSSRSRNRDIYSSPGTDNNRHYGTETGDYGR